MSTVACLLSRQSKRPHGGLSWVQQLLAAVDWAGRAGHTVLTSLGMHTWELTLAATRCLNVPAEVLVTCNRPVEEAGFRRWLDSEFGHPNCRLLTHVNRDGRKTDRELSQWRDELIVLRADVLMPISIRTGGGMSRLLAEQEADGKAVNRTFQIPYAERADRLAYAVPTVGLSKKIQSVGQDYLTHWTRAASAKWPDETAWSYYRDLLQAASYPRTAYATLHHILFNRALVASSRHMPNATPTVAFTALSIEQILPLMRWRAKYAEMAFEPYGIGIRRELAGELGIYPVQYYDPEVAFTACTVEAWLTQSIGTKTDWRQECEYRHKGNLSLAQLPADALIAFCPTQKEAATLERVTGINSVALFG